MTEASFSAPARRVITAIDGPIFTVTVNRPERRNAVDIATARALVEAFDQFERTDSLAVAILTGAGGHFCAGADLKALSENPEGESQDRLNDDGDGPLGPTRMRLTKPVIAAVEGYAVAGGLELALWCDMRVVAENATLGVFCRRFGVPLIDLGTVRLPRLIGHSRAMDLILTGRPVDAREALEIGLANRLAAPGGALKAAAALAEEIAALPQNCLRHDRLSAIQQWGLTEDEAMRNEMRHGRATIDSGETADGADDFSAGAGRGGKKR